MLCAEDEAGGFSRGRDYPECRFFDPTDRGLTAGTPDLGSLRLIACEDAAGIDRRLGDFELVEADAEGRNRNGLRNSTLRGLDDFDGRLLAGFVG